MVVNLRSEGRGFSKIFFCLHCDCWSPASDSAPGSWFTGTWRPVHRFSARQLFQLEAGTFCRQTGVWTSPCISTGGNVQKRRDLLPPEICTPSVQAGYRACPAHRNVRKPLSLWRKSRLSTVNAAFTTITIFYVYLLIKQIKEARCEKPGCARSWPGDKSRFFNW